MTIVNQIIRNSKQIIKNNKLPTCSTCVFYQENILANKKKDIFCTKFGIKNVISGTIYYDRVYEARLDNDKCGVNGEYFIQKFDEVKT
jgi:hypothetical protein